jgi:glutathione S-transferase
VVRAENPSASATSPTADTSASSLPRLTLYVVHGSHPCAAVEKALELKGLDYGVVEWPPTLHAPLQRIIFGARTVPALSLGGEHVSGSRAIMRRLEELVPEPPLYPAEARGEVDEAERWGDEVFQPIARELVWAGFRHNPGAMVSYGKHSRLRLPPAAIRVLAPLITRIGARLNGTDVSVARRDLERLPGYLDRIDAWIVAGTIGDTEHPNAADLQIGSTVRRLLTVADARPLIEGHLCAKLARQLFPEVDGELPAYVRAGARA